MTLILAGFTDKQLIAEMARAKKEGGCRNISLYNKCEHELRRRNGK